MFALKDKWLNKETSNFYVRAEQSVAEHCCKKSNKISVSHNQYRMRYWIWIICISLGSVETAYAQVPSVEIQAPRRQGVDSLRASGRVRPRFVISLDTRNSFIADKPVNIWGGNLGFAYGKHHRITFGCYFLQPESYRQLLEKSRITAIIGKQPQYTGNQIYFGSFMYQYNIVNNRRFLVAVPSEIGGGVSNIFRKKVLTGERTGGLGRDIFLPVQLGLYVEWRATRYIGLSGQFGYRYTLVQTDIKQNYDGTYYSYGTTIYPEVFRWVRDKVFKRKEPRNLPSTSG